MTNQLSLSNVINISVAAAQTGLGRYNVNNLAIFTSETAGEGFDSSAGYKIYLGPSEVATDFGTDSVTYKMALSVFSQTPNILNGNGYLVVIKYGAGDPAETLEAAILRASSLVQFFGILTTSTLTSSQITAVSDYAQTIKKLFFTVTNDAADFASDGVFKAIMTKGNNHTRCLSYLATDVTESKKFAAAYAGRALSTNFDGSFTTQTMHLKDMIGIEPDPVMTQTQLNLCQTAGVDVYVSIAGVPKVFTSGANDYFDQIYNLLWFIGELEVAGFNCLATTSTKVPQTEQGMLLLKGYYRDVCEKAVRCGYVAAGSWNSPDRFGNPADLLRNIADIGYYMYSLPVNQQSQVEREQRLMPLVQIAVKEAGAGHKSNVIVYVNP